MKTRWRCVRGASAAVRRGSLCCAPIVSRFCRSKPPSPVAQWVRYSPRNATNPSEVKYDYDTIVAPAGRDGRGLAIYTLGGDRETFNFSDPTQWLNVDNGVLRYSLSKDSK
jgi:hypothetical protein